MSNYIQRDSRMRDAWTLFIQKGILKREVIPDRVVYSWVRCRLKNLDPNTDAIKVTLTQDVERIQRTYLSSILAVQRLLKALYTDLPYYFLTLNHLILYSSDSFGDWIFEGIEYSEEFHGTNALDMAMDSNQCEVLAGHEHYKSKLHSYGSASLPMGENGLFLNLIFPLSNYEQITDKLSDLDEQLQSLQSVDNPQMIDEAVSHSVKATVTLNKQEVISAIPFSPFMCIYRMVTNQIIPFSKESEHLFFEIENSKLFIERVQKAFLQNERTFLYPFESEHIIVKCQYYDDQKFIGIAHIEEWLAASNQWVGHRALYTLNDIQGKSDLIQKTVFNARKAASHSAPILVIGERGTGKSAFAQGIHMASNRSEGPFIAIDCESTPLRALESILFGSESDNGFGALTLSKGGTLYLDHIESLPNPLQKRLLKHMDHEGDRQEATVRFIFSTSLDIKLFVQQGIIREDFYHRISLFTLHIPPLRERRSDIEELAVWLIRELTQLYNIEEPLLEDNFLNTLTSYPWKGNAGELQQVLQDLLISQRQNPILKVSYLHQKMNQHQMVKVGSQFNLEQMEKEVIQSAIEASDSNLSKAAELLGIGRTTLYRKIEKYGINL